MTATNTFGAAGLLARRTGSTSTFYQFDPQGSVVQRLNSSGTPQTNYCLDAWGVGTSSGGAATDPWVYGAQWGYFTDRETGLLLLTHRFYDPGTGRFLNRDPIGYVGGVNLYGYVANGPVSASDAAGLSPDFDNQHANNLARRIDMLRRKIAEREGELRENPGKLPERAPGDGDSPRLSRWGHRKLINMDKAQKSKLEKELGEMLGGPVGTEKKECRVAPHKPQPWWQPWVKGARGFFGLDKPSPYGDFPGGSPAFGGGYVIPGGPLGLPGFGGAPSPVPTAAPIESPFVPEFVFGI